MSYGPPAIFAGKKGLVRIGTREKDTIQFRAETFEERDHLMEMDPKTYFITDHYKDYPSVLVRIARIDAEMLRKMLERRWRRIAPKTLIKKVEAAAKKTVKKAEKKT